jgi:hypothetical protein
MKVHVGRKRLGELKYALSSGQKFAPIQAVLRTPEDGETLTHVNRTSMVAC